MKKIVLSMLLIMTIIFAGCSSSDDYEEQNVLVEVDSENEAQTPSVEESIEEDFSTEVEDIEIGELI